MDKSHMFWGNKDVIYADGHSIPRVTYRCKGSAMKPGRTDAGNRKHLCKLVTDHPKACICICGISFNDKEVVT